MHLRLRLPLARDEAEVLAAQRELGAEGFVFAFLHRGQTFAEFVRMARTTATVVARAGGVERVLVTCDDDNLASRGVIEANGGVLENIVEVDGVPLRRYWID